MRHQINHRIQFLDGVFRLIETSSNDVTRTITEFDMKDHAGEALSELEKMPMDPGAKMMMFAMLSNPDALLYYGCDITVKGWFDHPAPPDDALEDPDPDPSGGIRLDLSMRVPMPVMAPGAPATPTGVRETAGASR